MNISDYGFLRPNGMTDAEYERVARVTAAHRERFELASNYGEVYARIKVGAYAIRPREEYPAVGDFVLINYNPMGDSVITDTLPRRTSFSRTDPSNLHAEQFVATNFDYAFLTSSLNHDFNTKRLERYLSVTLQSRATPVMLLTKLDLCPDPSEYVDTLHALFPGIDVVCISSKTGEGMDALSKYMQPGTTSVFLGSSGVGKSSVLNRLAGRELMAVSGIREDDSKGRHTTTHRELVMLDSGAMIIDTPGMRQLSMYDANEGVSGTFFDISTLEGQCRFPDCTHTREPGCAILAALKDGTLDQKRYDRYIRLMKEASRAAERGNAPRKKKAFMKK